MIRVAKICSPFALLWVLALPLHGADSCSDLWLKPGLFERWVILDRMLDRVKQSHPGESPESGSVVTLKREAETIGRQYSRFVSAVADSAYRGDKAEVTALCARSGDDPIGLLTCRLANYIIGERKQKDQFVEQFPTRGKHLRALWMLDRIPSGESGRPILFEPDGPTDLYITELYDIVETGDSRALGAFMRVYCAADGEYAEFMQDKMERLLREHTEVALRNWIQLKKCSAFLGNLREMLPADRKREILTKSQQYCATYRAACEDLERLFSQ